MSIVELKIAIFQIVMWLSFGACLGNIVFLTVGITKKVVEEALRKLSVNLALALTSLIMIIILDY